MVDLSKVSESVLKVITEIAKDGGDKKKIDTERECVKIGEYLNGNRDKLTQSDIVYLESFIGMGSTLNPEEVSKLNDKTAGMGSKLNPEECKISKYYKA